MSEFSPLEWQRYQRHVQLSKFGALGQSRIKNAHVLIVGAGGLGCPVSQYLAAAGVGRITLVDADIVSRTNLQRQILFGEQDVGEYKVSVAKQRLLANNPHITIDTIKSHLTEDNAELLIAKADLVLDCSDNFACRYLINEACVQLKKPWIYASITEYDGQLALFTPETGCFRCIFPEAPQNAVDCNSAGVLGSLPGVVGTLQATEALKYLAGLDGSLAGKLLLIEGLYANTRTFNLNVANDCFCQTGTKPEVSPAVCATNTQTGLSPQEFKATMETHLLVDVRSEVEHEAFSLGGELIPFSAEAADEFVGAVKAKYRLDQPLALYCQSGARSDKAAKALAAHGYSNIIALQGGLACWLDWLN